ncbi:DNA-binding transcriptional regulator, MarR family [Deinococcus reticulitermitis]|uniref:DNA-binding transcriptional regulator, MarR family n=2 Tax=Deinococcus reticulitermitis TaxID=856736 RepID=A0A1H6VRK3_9DEIO|nr:DNA-binding transcriptional regulator, MarR family [Deinococcus reticulitermitis]
MGSWVRRLKRLAAQTFLPFTRFVFLKGCKVETMDEHCAAPGPAPPDVPDAVDVRRLGEAFKRLQRHVGSAVMSGMQDELQSLDLSFTQVAALHQLRAHAPLTVTQLSELTRLSLPAASHLTERLVRRGLARRQENPDNRRERLLTLTAQGEHTVSKLDAGLAAGYVAIFSRLDPATVQATEKQLSVLLAELETLPRSPYASPEPS